MASSRINTITWWNEHKWMCEWYSEKSKLNYKWVEELPLKFQNLPNCFVILHTWGNLKYILVSIYPKAAAGTETPTFVFVCLSFNQINGEGCLIYPFHSSDLDGNTFIQFAFSMRVQPSFQNNKILSFLTSWNLLRMDLKEASASE